MASVAGTNPRAQTRGIGELDLRTKMKAAWYAKQGATRDVMIVGEMDDPQPPNKTGDVTGADERT
jgi:hypothetical protein